MKHRQNRDAFHLMSIEHHNVSINLTPTQCGLDSRRYHNSCLCCAFYTLIVSIKLHPVIGAVSPIITCAFLPYSVTFYGHKLHFNYTVNLCRTRPEVNMGLQYRK